MRMVELPIKSYDYEKAIQKLKIDPDAEAEPDLEECKDTSVLLDLDAVDSLTESYYPGRCTITIGTKTWHVFMDYKKIRDMIMGKSYNLIKKPVQIVTIAVCNQ